MANLTIQYVHLPGSARGLREGTSDFSQICNEKMFVSPFFLSLWRLKYFILSLKILSPSLHQIDFACITCTKIYQNQIMSSLCIAVYWTLTTKSLSRTRTCQSQLSLFFVPLLYNCQHDLTTNTLKHLPLADDFLIRQFREVLLTPHSTQLCGLMTNNLLLSSNRKLSDIDGKQKQNLNI